MSPYFLGAVSFIALLAVSGVVFILAKKFRFPYTIALVAFGILIALLAKFVPALQFLTAFKLSPETLLYVFLPILLFESAYNIRFREMIQHTRAISLLAVVGLILAALLAAVILYFIFGLLGIAVPFLVLFAFGTLISATDPVSVLALFKEMGAPRRLTLLFEGESLFNDGTALALFLVILSIMIPGYGAHNWFSHLITHMIPGQTGLMISGFLSFILMILVGFIVGGAVGYLASRSVVFLKKSKMLEITLTLIIAHATFLFAEWINHMFVPVSAVIATTVAALVMGNYGRYKLSSETRHMMGEYWEFFAFIANSLVFILVGVLIIELNIRFSEVIIPTLIAIAVIAFARAVSVYAVLLPLNAMKKEFIIPDSWLKLLSWGSLRGSLAIIMALMIPEDFTLPVWTLETSIRDFVLALTIGCIVFTTFVKATSIPSVLKKLKITAPTSIDDADYKLGRVMFLLRLLAKIDSTYNRGFLTTEQKEKLQEKFQKELSIAEKKLLESKDENSEIILERALALHALEMEKAILVQLFNHNEISEWILRRMMNKMDSQIERVESGKTQIKEAYEHKLKGDLLQNCILKIVSKFREKHNPHFEKYYKARTRSIVLEKVLSRFEILHTIPAIADSEALKDLENLYKGLLETSRNIRKELYQKEEIKKLEERIVKKMLHIRKHEILENLYHSGLVSNKTVTSLEEKYITH